MFKHGVQYYFRLINAFFKLSEFDWSLGSDLFNLLTFPGQEMGFWAFHGILRTQMKATQNAEAWEPGKVPGKVCRNGPDPFFYGALVSHPHPF